MTKYEIPGRLDCWKCSFSRDDVEAQYDEHIVHWSCPKCESSNVVAVSSQIPIGERLFLAGRKSHNEGDSNIGAILIYSAIDAMLSNSIFELENYFSAKKGNVGRSREEIREELRVLKMNRKVAWLEGLSGSTIGNLIDEHKLKFGAKSGFEGFSITSLVNDCKRLAKARNEFVHEGVRVPREVIEQSLRGVQRAVILLSWLRTRGFA